MKNRNNNIVNDIWILDKIACTIFVVIFIYVVKRRAVLSAI